MSAPDPERGGRKYISSVPSIPGSFSRMTLLTCAVVAAVVGVLLGQRAATPPDAGVPVTTPEQAAPIASTPGEFPALGRGLLSLSELAVIGEPATGGTYTRGSASALPDPCSRPAPGDAGVSYVSGPLGASAVSFQLIGGSVTERVTTLDDEAAAREHLQALVTRVRTCLVDPAVNVELATIGPGVGDEYVQAMVTRNYQSGSSSTVAILLVRVRSVLVEFSLTGSTAAAADVAGRCRAISLAGLAP